MEHDGHRQRMYAKIKSENALHDHEQLEVLLFNAYPRINTNPIAHALLDAFGSLRGVLEADYKELMRTEGVGEKVATYIKCVAACARTAYGIGSEEAYLKNYGDFKEFAGKRLRNRSEETLEIYCCEKNGRVKYIYSETNRDTHRVVTHSETFTRLLAIQKPCGIVIAHNHLTGSCTPSEQDNQFTAQVQVMCSLAGVVLYDHCIYAADNKVFSYFDTGKIDEIKKKYNLTEMFKNL